jgi:hypothetical protein
MKKIITVETDFGQKEIIALSKMFNEVLKKFKKKKITKLETKN